MTLRPRSLFLLAGLACGCAPLTPTPPFHFGESAKTLPKGRSSATLSLGTGAMNWGNATGAGLRLRQGLGGRQEVGIEALVLGVENDDRPTPQQPWRGRSNAVSGKLSYKAGLKDWFAVSLGLGGANAATGDALGGDAGVHASLTKPWGIFRPYLGLRYSVGLPLNRGWEEAGGPTQGLAGALGGMLEFSRRFHGYVEAGRLQAWHSGYVSTAADPGRRAQYLDHVGTYAALGLTTYFSLD